MADGNAPEEPSTSTVPVIATTPPPVDLATTLLEMAAQGPLSTVDTAEILALTKADARDALADLVDTGRLERIGQTRGTRYILPGTQIDASASPPRVVTTRVTVGDWQRDLLLTRASRREPLVDDGFLEKQGQRRGTRYVLPGTGGEHAHVEHRVLTDPNVRAVWDMTETSRSATSRSGPHSVSTPTTRRNCSEPCTSPACSTAPAPASNGSTPAVPDLIRPRRLNRPCTHQAKKDRIHDRHPKTSFAHRPHHRSSHVRMPRDDVTFSELSTLAQTANAAENLEIGRRLLPCTALSTYLSMSPIRPASSSRLSDSADSAEPTPQDGSRSATSPGPHRTDRKSVV